MTIKQQIVTYVKTRGTVSGMELELKAREWRSKPSTISRRARELAMDGALVSQIKDKTVSYGLPQRDAFDPEVYLQKLRQEEIAQGQLL